ncbi:MAG TPA: hypothetical protein DCM67_09335 [Propionibacteriaceae bacterium]|nr:hypothetical protein [Propionibacteriaceae bacterium]
MASTRYYRRRFLNRRGYHAGAYVIADVHLERFGSGASRNVEVCASLTIADCGRVTTLDFDMPDARSTANALYKARLLQEVVNGFVAALEECARVEDEPEALC